MTNDPNDGNGRAGPDSGEVYRALSARVYVISADRALVLAPESGAVIDTDGTTAKALAACVGVKTLQAHADSVYRSTRTSDLRAAQHAIQALVGMRLLEPVGEHAACEPARGDASAGISTIGVLTADRPWMLERCLISYADDCHHCSSQVRFLVIDSSRQRHHAAGNRAVCRRIQKTSGYPVTYMGDDEQSKFRSAVVNAEAAAGFGVSRAPSGVATPGASRNILLLATAGEMVLSVDDDTICRSWRASEVEEGICVADHCPWEHEFFDTREAATAVASGTGRDELLVRHSRVIGQSVRNLASAASGECDVSSACHDFVDGIVGTGLDQIVRVSLAGLAGDSALSCPHRLLFSRGITRLRMASHRDVYTMALTSREVRRSVRRLTVSHHPHCMMYCTALDNSKLLPPYMPMGRNEDGLFGVVLSLVDPTHCSAYLPSGIVHDSTRPSTYGRRRIVSASQIRVCDLIGTMLHTVQTPKTFGVSSRIQRIGDVLVDIGSLPLRAFRVFVKEAVIGAVTRDLLWATSVASAEFDYPEYWQQGFEEYKDQCLASLRDESFFSPVDCRVDSWPTRDALENARCSIRQFGELLHVWPGLWEHVRGVGACDLSSWRV